MGIYWGEGRGGYKTRIGGRKQLVKKGFEPRFHNKKVGKKGQWELAKDRGTKRV